MKQPLPLSIAVVTNAIGTLVLAGCVSVPDYPTEWSALSQHGDACPALAGVYLNKGELSPNDQRKFPEITPLLSSHLFEKADELRSADRVEVGFDQNRVLTIRVLRGDDLLREASFSEKESTLRCTPPAAELLAYSGATRGISNPVAGAQFGSTLLARAGDGALVIKRSEGSAGLVFLLVPIAAYQARWVRFPVRC